MSDLTATVAPVVAPAVAVDASAASAKVEPVTSEANAGTPAKVEPPKAEARPGMDATLTTRLAILERKQAKLNETNRAVEAKLAQASKLDEAIAAFEADPVAFLKSRGKDSDKVLADFLSRQIPPSKDEELEALRARDAERQETEAKTKEAEAAKAREAAAAEAQSANHARAIADVQAAITALPGEAGDILQGMMKDGTKLSGVDRLGQDVELSPETYVLAAATEEWQSADSPKLSPQQFKKLIAHCAARLNTTLANADDGAGGKVGDKYRKVKEPAKITSPTAVTEMGGGERAPLGKPQTRGELERLFRRAGR